jgi:hypothetical protein
MMQIVLIGLGAGAASALLFASIATGSLAAMLLVQLAPLPILIAAIGWSHRAAIVAALTGALGMAIVLGVRASVAFTIGTALPGWWLGYLAMLARPAGNGGHGGLEWYPPGRLLLWAALISAFMVAVALPGTDQESFQATVRAAFERTMRAQAPELPLPPETSRLIEVLVIAIPAMGAAIVTLTNVINLWLAGTIVRMSGRLRRPWPDLASAALPPLTQWLLLAAIAGLFLPAPLGTLAAVLAATLLMAYAIIGFAVLHAVTRGIPMRPLVLTAAYASVFVLAGWPIPAAALLGLADGALNIRGRFAGRAGPPILPT